MKTIVSLIAACTLCCTVVAHGQGVVLTPKDDYESIPTRSNSSLGKEAPDVGAVADQQPSDPAAEGKATADAKQPLSPALAMSMVPEVGGGFDDEYELPERMSLRKYLPPPGQQGKASNCVAWAIAHAAYSCQICQQRHRTPQDDCHKFSPMFLYEQLRDEQGGLDPSKVIDFVKVSGCASLATMPADATAASKQAVIEAKNFRAAHKQRPTNLEDIKTFIYEGYPVVMVVYLDDEFKSTDAGTSPYKWSGGKSSGLHAVTAVGYDDTRHAIEIMNSWGTTWKDAGYCWVSYENLKLINDDNWCPRAYVVKVKESAPFNMRTDDQRYQLKKDRRVYQYRGSAVTLSDWEIDDAVCTGDSLFVLRRDQKLFRYNQDDGSWTVLNDGILKDKLIAMTAADRFNPLHILTSDGELFTYRDRSGQWSRVSSPPKLAANVVDLRVVLDDDGSRELRATTSNGRVFTRNDNATWSLAP